jgi:hypothetical protein
MFARARSTPKRIAISGPRLMREDGEDLTDQSAIGTPEVVLG